MNKYELTTVIMKAADTNRTHADQILNDILNSITDTLVNGERVKISGFGSFYTKDNPARKGTNPSTGAYIDIPAKTVAKFKVGTHLANAVKK